VIAAAPTPDLSLGAQAGERLIKLNFSQSGSGFPLFGDPAGRLLALSASRY